MAQADSIAARQALAAYQAAGQAKPGTREAKARAAADGFESTFAQNLVETLFSGLGEEGPLGGQSAQLWRGFYAEELSKGMTKGGRLGIAPQIYREMFRHQEAAHAQRG
jgi:peptidoglycan hydrolase FlgJ